MATETVKESRLFGAAPVHVRVAAINAVAVFLGLGASFMAGPGVAKGFAAGYAIGLLNLLWLLRIASRGLVMTPERAGRYVAIRYYLRFILTAGVFIILIKNGILSPWPPVAGLSASIFATIGALVISAREETS